MDPPPETPEPPPEYHLSLELLARRHSPDTALNIFQAKVRKRPLILRPTTEEDQPEDIRKAREKKREQKAATRGRRKKRPPPLSAKQKRALNIYDISKEEQKYAIYEPLHRMWLGYIREILGLDASAARGYGGFVVPKSAGPLLASADYHGALLEVVRSRCVSRVGLRGIVVKDTKFTYEMITPNNELKIVPKEHTIFKFEIPLAQEALEGGKQQRDSVSGEQQRSLVFELHGPAFENRAAERATKRVKLHLPSDL